MNAADEQWQPALDWVPVLKDNLIIFDPDFTDDYRAEHELSFSIPAGWQILLAKGIPRRDAAGAAARQDSARPGHAWG